MNNITEKQAEELIARGVERAFISMGIDINNPLEMQQDLAFVRRLRKVWVAFITATILNLLYAAGHVKDVLATVIK